MVRIGPASMHALGDRIHGMMLYVSKETYVDGYWTVA